MKKTPLISIAIIFSVLLALIYIFVETDRLLRETLAGVGGTNVSVEVCPIFTNQIPRECSLATDQEAARSSLLRARKQLPLGHPESLQKFFFRIRFVADNRSNIYCFIADQYKDQENILFLSRLGFEKSCGQGRFEYQSGSLAIDNFVTNAGSR